MALSGELSDLSLAELIEFFCNQRKTGRLKISYQRAPGFFYFQNGALADAKIGVLRGVEAVYYALTLENAQFKFSPSFPPDERTINQPWAQVALEGLRRMDEGVTPTDAFPTGSVTFGEDGELLHSDGDSEEAELNADATGTLPYGTPVNPGDRTHTKETSSPLSMMVEASSSGKRKFAVIGAVGAVLLIVAGIGVPAGWYGNRKVAAAPAAVTQPGTTNPAPVADGAQDPAAVDPSAPTNAATSSMTVADPTKAARDRAKAEEKARQEHDKQTSAANPAAATTKPEAVKAGPKMVTVQVSYDENGRVTQVSGADATATRIARQRRFPAGKAGSTTVTIPIN